MSFFSLPSFFFLFLFSFSFFFSFFHFLMSEAVKKQKMSKRRVGIVGYGHLGRYLAKCILEDPKVSEKLDLAFVWNRSADKIDDIDAAYILHNLDDFAQRKADLIVEVAHPIISKTHGPKFLESADYVIGSPTALADREVEAALREYANKPNGHGVYIPVGALWGAQDIRKMADRGTLKALTVTMKKAPHHLKVEPPLEQKVKDADNFQGETIIFKGSVRELCPLAPNNVNTMAAAAIAGHTLGLDHVTAVLIADPRLEKHVIEIDVEGPGEPGNKFRVITSRENPAAKGAVTGAATYASFLSSILAADGLGDGVHLV